MTTTLPGIDPHAIEGAVHEEHCYKDAEDGRRYPVLRNLLCQLDRQKAKEGGEFDYRIHRYGRCVFEGVTNSVANHRRGMQVGTLLLQLHLDDFLCVVPSAAGIGHEERLEQPEERNSDQITYEKETFQTSKC